jgi:hypothetical protein
MDPTTLRMMAGATAPPASIIFSADNSYPAGNASVQLSWSTLYAQSVSIDQGIGSVATNGTTSVTGNNEARTYTLSAVGFDGITYSSAITITWANQVCVLPDIWYCSSRPDRAECAPICTP